LAAGNTAIALLANALATGCALYVLILSFGPVSGAHMNPCVTLAAGLLGEFPKKDVLAYWLAQAAGAIVGVWIAHGMFDLPLIQTSQQERAGVGQGLAEAMAVVGLMAVIWRCASYGTPVLASAVAAYITGAYWFTASTSFANPAVTIARTLTSTFSGIEPGDGLVFVCIQVLTVIVMVGVLRAFKALGD
jgi:glycerol uptake facilitator-like aquaporin